MMRVSVADRARLSVFVGRRAFRSLIARFNAHPFTRWRYGSTSTVCEWIAGVNTAEFR